MNEAITVGAVVWFVVVIGALFGVGGLLFWVLSVIASGYKH